jgi:hypothetical protein
MRIIVTGLIGQYAFGGVTWDYIQYVLGFRALGHDVWYLEDTGMWAYDPVKMEPSADCSHNTAYLARVMEDFDMGDRWIYRNAADETWHGASHPSQILAAADVLANVSGACWLRGETSRIPLKLFLDGDPMFTQIGLATDPGSDYARHAAAHERHFSFGLNIGRPGCEVPCAGFEWRPTVQPIALEYWSAPVDVDVEKTPHVADGAWTTVMNWASYAPKEFQGKKYGQKDVEFGRFLDLPTLTHEKFVLAMGQGIGNKRPTAMLESKGWHIIEPDSHLPDYRTYRDFLSRSKGEWSIAKNGYVLSQSGWFSCRSACYLAAGKPVVVQDTGWSAHLPSGDGVIAFTTPQEAAAALERVSQNYAHHARAAREYAEKYFDAAKVCAALLE